MKTRTWKTTRKQWVRELEDILEEERKKGTLPWTPRLVSLKSLIKWLSNEKIWEGR